MSVSFGTSGLRGLAVSFDAGCVAAYISAFLDHVGVLDGQEVFLGCDLRRSSPEISTHAYSTIKAHGQVPVWAGVVPTPALAAASLARNVPAIIITGSHIPENYNGIKFYRPDGELLKSDEEPIRKRVEEILSGQSDPASHQLPNQAESYVAEQYISRYVSAFGSGALSGLKLGLFMHSAAGRDIMETIFTALGADVLPFGHSDEFVAVDTEALDPESIALCAQMISEHNLDAVISTDGDGDRPLLIGPDGQQINGDVLCALAAHGLGIKAIVTPLTSTTAIELSGWFSNVTRTRIGSPYVVEAMAQSDLQPIAGFEANGGMLLGSDITLAGSVLTALPTRDAVLPLIAALGDAKSRDCSLSVLVGELPPRFMKADRIKQVPHTLSAQFLGSLEDAASLRERLHHGLLTPVSIDQTDGVRFEIEDGSIIHFRASGNAPELRVYVETGDAAGATQLLKNVMTKLKQSLQDFA